MGIIDFATHPITELMAILSFLLYVVLCAKGNIWCWAAGFLTAFLYTFIFLGVHLPAQVTLNILYMVMAIWGWSAWLEDKPKGAKSKYSYWSWRYHLMIFPALILILWGSVWLFPFVFQHDLVYLDAAATVGGIYATILTIYRKIESWIYWMALNALTYFLYFEEGLTQTALLSIFNTFISVYGFINWRKYRKLEIQRNLAAGAQ